MARLTADSIKLGLCPNVSKIKVMKVNCTNNRPVKLRDTILEEVTSFAYLGSIVSIFWWRYQGQDKQSQRSFQHAGWRKVWSSHIILHRTKFRIFNINVKASLLYGSETWRITEQKTQKLQSSLNKVNFKDQLDRKGNKQDSVGKSKRGTNRDLGIKEKVEMDRSHLKETG